MDNNTGNPPQPTDRKLHIVKLMEPALCLACRFASIATVELRDGSTRKMLHCKRELCDNHIAREK